MYLEECLNSICNQTYKNLEIILVDDGSTDLSGEICDNYAFRDKRIRVIHQENAGAAIAKNTGLDVVSGDLIAFCDSDDYVDVNWIRTRMQAMERTGADVVECAFYRTFTDGSVYQDINCEEETVYSVNEYMGQYLDSWTGSLFWNKLFKANLVKNTRFKYERRCVDDEFFTYKAITGAYKVTKIPEALYYYRVRKSSAMNSVSHKEQLTIDAMELRPERYMWIKDNFPECSSKYLFKDIDYLVYLSTTGTFTDNSAKLYKKIIRFYLKECLKILPQKMTLNYIWLILKYSSVKENGNKYENLYLDNYFD